MDFGLYFNDCEKDSTPKMTSSQFFREKFEIRQILSGFTLILSFFLKIPLFFIFHFHPLNSNPTDLSTSKKIPSVLFFPESSNWRRGLVTGQTPQEVRIKWRNERRFKILDSCSTAHQHRTARTPYRAPQVDISVCMSTQHPSGDVSPSSHDLETP